MNHSCHTRLSKTRRETLDRGETMNLVVDKWKSEPCWNKTIQSLKPYSENNTSILFSGEPYSFYSNRVGAGSGKGYAMITRMVKPLPGAFSLVPFPCWQQLFLDALTASVSASVCHSNTSLNDSHLYQIRFCAIWALECCIIQSATCKTELCAAAVARCVHYWRIRIGLPQQHVIKQFRTVYCMGMCYLSVRVLHNSICNMQNWIMCSSCCSMHSLLAHSHRFAIATPHKTIQKCTMYGCVLSERSTAA